MLSLLQPKPVQMCCASYYQTFFFVTPAMILSVWDLLFFYLLQCHFSYSQTLCFLCSRILGSSEEKKNLTCWKTTPAVDSKACPYRLSTQLWHCFLLYVSYITQVSSPSQSTHVAFVRAIGTCCSIPELPACNCHFSHRGKLIQLDIFSIIHFYLPCHVPDMTRSR